MLGLDARSMAANTAIADQTITTSMQAQGRLAQTYLPLAKAYMTIIVVSVSWLMAIICIMLGSYHHIKMFFTLCLTMVLWTPILSLINFLNDLNIQHTFAELVLKNDAALTYSNYKEVIQKVTENSNFLKYLVMMTPMLAFALAKGSEMGFVSIASSLSQQLAMGSRAAGSFATQQALSTSTAITSPRADEMYVMGAGKFGLQNATYDSFGNLITQNTESGINGGPNNSTFSSAAMSGINAAGVFQNGKLTGGGVGATEAIMRQASDKLSQAWSDVNTNGFTKADSAMLNDFFGKNVTQSDTARESFLQNLAKEVENSTSMSDSVKTHAQSAVNAKVGAELFGSGGGVSFSVGATMNSDDTKSWSEKDKAAYQEAVERAKLRTISEDEGLRSEFSKIATESKSTTFSNILSAAQDYQEAQTSQQAVQGNILNNIINGYARDNAAASGADWNSLTTAQQNAYFAEAGAYVNHLAQHDRGTLVTLANEYGGGMLTENNIGGGPQARGMGLGSGTFNPQDINAQNKGIVGAYKIDPNGNLNPNFMGEQTEKKQNDFFGGNTVNIAIDHYKGNTVKGANTVKETLKGAGKGVAKFW